MEGTFEARRSSALSKFFIAAGILVILALFTALIGPHFVDWTSYRAAFESEASKYLGRPVAIAGKVDVRVLPTPVISFTGIRVGDSEAPDVEMERFRAEIELATLLKGEIRVIQMTLERPQFRVELGNFGANAGALADWRVDPEKISLAHLEIADGVALISDAPSGREWRLDGIDATIEAETLMGPARVNAALTLDGRPVTLAAALGRIADNAVTAKLAFRTPDYPVSLSIDGTWHFPGTEAAKYEGVATLEGVPSDDRDAPRSMWADFRAAGQFVLTPTELALEETKISFGAMERPLILEASGRLDLGAAPRFEVSLAARQIDLDRTLGGGAEEPVSIEAAFAALAEALPRANLPALPGELHLEAQGVVLGGGVIQAVGIDLATAPNAWEVENLAAMLPGDTRVDLKGTLGIDPEPTFVGHGRVASRRPSAFAAWWRGETGSAANIGRFEIEADLDLQTENMRFSNLLATTGAGTVKGSLDVRRFSRSGQRFVKVDLTADRADLVESKAIAELFAGKNFGAGTVEQMTLSLRADVLSAGGVDAQSVVVEGGLESGRLNLRQLSVADLEGASIDALGSVVDPFGKPSGRIEASVQAADFRGAADFLASFAPDSAIARRLKAVAPSLSPVNAEISAEGGGAPGERLAISLTGSFADTHLTVAAEGTGSLDDPGSLAGKLSLHADGGGTAEVLRQIGLHPLPVPSGPLRIDASFEGALASAGKLTLGGTVAGVDLDYAAETKLRDNRVELSGPFKATSKDIDPLLLLGGIAVPGVGEGHAASVSGRLDYSKEGASLMLDEASFAGQRLGGALHVRFSPDIELAGALDLKSASLPFLASLAAGAEPGISSSGWSETPFTAAMPPGVALDVTFNAETLDVGAHMPATQAKLDFSLSAGVLNLDLAEAGFAGGSLKGAISATFDEGESDVTVRGGLSGADLQAFVWEDAGLPAASGKLDLSLDANGRGKSLAGIIATLGGSGSFSVKEGRLNALNADALGAVMALAEVGTQEPDQQEARETFARQFGSGVLRFGEAAGAFSISGGVTTVPTVSISDGAATILAGARFDLKERTLTSDWVVRAVGEGDEASQPSVQAHFSGPIADPERRIDLDPLLNRLRSRFLERQIEELEALQEAARQRAEERRMMAAERRDRDLGEGLRVVPPTPPPEPVPQPTPPREPSPFTPSLLDPMPLIVPDPASVQVGPDLPPPPARSAPAQTPPRAAAIEPAPVPAAPAPSQIFDYEYRVLPNGTIVKVR